VGAKVNGRIVPLKHTLQNGDRVEILTRHDHKPSRDWLGFVKSAGAKSRIQAFIREEERAHAITLGHERLDREARNMGVRLDEPEAQAKLEARLAELKLASWDAAYAALGFGRLTVHKLIEPLIPEPERAQPKENTSNLMDSVVVGDTTGILYTLAACCKPIWGDEVVGYITRTRGTAIHRADCPQLLTTTMHPERRVNVAWGKHGAELYDTEIALTTEDRPGMVAAISEGIQRVGINVQRFHGSATEEGSGLFHIALRARDRTHLVELMAGLRRIRGVYTVERVKGSVFGKVK
jgi:GTP pyrophosphokinase